MERHYEKINKNEREEKRENKSRESISSQELCFEREEARAENRKMDRGGGRRGG